VESPSATGLRAVAARSVMPLALVALTVGVFFACWPRTSCSTRSSFPPAGTTSAFSRAHPCRV